MIVANHRRSYTGLAMLIIVAVMLLPGVGHSSSDDGQPSQAKRVLAPWPPASGQLRVIIDTDAANEIDDQYALALVLASQDRLNILENN